jgi:hypothetical protein
LFTPTAIVAIVKANNPVRTAGRNHACLNLLTTKVAINCTLDVKNVTRNGNRNKLVRGDAGYNEAAWATTAAKHGDRHKTWTSSHFRLPLSNLRHANTKPISAMVAITKVLVINPAASGAGSIVEGSGPLRGSNLSSRPQAERIAIAIPGRGIQNEYSAGEVLGAIRKIYSTPKMLAAITPRVRPRSKDALLLETEGAAPERTGTSVTKSVMPGKANTRG